MSTANLQDWLINNRGFQEQYGHLCVDSVACQFSGLCRDDQVAKVEHDWRYLLLCASLLAQSDRGDCQEAALRIAQYGLEFPGALGEYRDAAAVILDILANRPSIRLAEQRGLIQDSYLMRLPLTLRRDCARRVVDNSITLSNFSTIEVNRFQRLFWKLAEVNDWVSISAPTSAGKSYIVGLWLAEFLRNNPLSNVVYVVPTRALIQQVQQDIESLLFSENIEKASVATLPLRSSIVDDKANVFVFTQERFHILLGEHDLDLSLGLLIIDEAQKIGDNCRGVLLQQAIESVVATSPKCKILFASPMTKNPEIFLEDAPDVISSAHLSSEDTTVCQNLLWVSQVPGCVMDWTVELISKSNPVQLGKIELPARPAPVSKRLPFVAFAMGNPEGGNVVYVNRPSDAEKVAKQLFDLVGEDPALSEDEEINALIDLIQKTIHGKYALCNVLRRGIAFHYGNIPLLIRTEIERLFSLNKIRYLACTSTLIEGVNMSCQNMFVRGPKKGSGTPMNPNDFWNLAGRAGRWGKEFQGNVVCVDAKRSDVWKEGPPVCREKYSIHRTSDNVLSQGAAILAFIDNHSPREEAAKNPNLEYVFSYLVSAYLSNGSISSTTWAHRFSGDLIVTLDEKIGKEVEKLKTPHDVILRNPGISPIAMDDLLDYFQDRTERREEPIEGLLPVAPESEDSVNEYSKILHRCNRYLGAYAFGRGRMVTRLALLIVDWMKGYPLARIISSREQFYKKRGNPPPLPSLIRSTMGDVEEVARFKAPRYLSCYVDLLGVYLKQIGRDDILGQLPSLNILLEFGVSQKTQLSLMGIGLSRSSAIAISEFITDDSLSESECLQWLRESEWMTEDMPQIIKQEVASLVNKSG